MTELKLIVILIITLLLSSTAIAEISIIAHQSSHFSKLTKDQVIRFFLGKKHFIEGRYMLAVDQSEGESSRTYFYNVILNISEPQLKSHWSRLVFTGKAQAPRVTGSDIETLNVVASNPSLIGYIDSKYVTDQVIELYRE